VRRWNGIAPMLLSSRLSSSSSTLTPLGGACGDALGCVVFTGVEFRLACALLSPGCLSFTQRPSEAVGFVPCAALRSHCVWRLFVMFRVLAAIAGGLRWPGCPLSVGLCVRVDA
jgi:hypothetical protein